MTDQTAFVDVQHVFVDYQLAAAWSWLVGVDRQYYSALQDVTVQLPHGAHITLYGAEAAGKSTLLRVLAGAIKPSRGTVFINGHRPIQVPQLAAGYVSQEETESSRDTGHQVLTAFGRVRHIDNVSARIREVSDTLGMEDFLYRPARSLSTTQRLKLNLARAAISDSPLVLLDDAADALGAETVSNVLPTLFAGRTVIAATRLAHVADALGLPVLLLHHSTLAYQGTIDEIALILSCPRKVDVWIEGLRYDLLRKLRNHTGVLEALLIPANQFSGQRLRITLNSSRYLPSLYDLISQAPVIKVQEIPPSLNDVLERI